MSFSIAMASSPTQYLRTNLFMSGQVSLQCYFLCSQVDFKGSRIWPAYQQSTTCRTTRAGPRSRATKRGQYQTLQVYRHMTRRTNLYSERSHAEPLSIILMARLSSRPSPTSLFLRNLQYQTVVRWRGYRCWQGSSCSSTLGRQYMWLSLKLIANQSPGVY